MPPQPNTAEAEHVELVVSNSMPSPTISTLRYVVRAGLLFAILSGITVGGLYVLEWLR